MSDAESRVIDARRDAYDEAHPKCDHTIDPRSFAVAKWAVHQGRAAAGVERIEVRCADCGAWAELPLLDLVQGWAEHADIDWQGGGS